MSTANAAAAGTTAAWLTPVELIVLGAILKGFATPTEAATIGAAGALALAVWRGGLDRAVVTAVVGRSAQMTSMNFLRFRIRDWRRA